ncbi:YciI family protein [Micromonospora sp. DT233]|uniref:YciI family protein n=1 Tax=Micromonospora sp. DT233 TaxID=3393432 RepID=UPI003CEBB2E4
MTGLPQVDSALDTYECIVLYPGAAGRALPEETVQRLQAEHTEHMLALQRRGIVLLVGSIDGPAREPDPPIGFGLARTGSVDGVRDVMQADPAVQAGLYRVDVLTFLCPAGSVDFPLVKTGS